MYQKQSEQMDLHIKAMVSKQAIGKTVRYTKQNKIYIWEIVEGKQLNSYNYITKN